MTTFDKREEGFEKKFAHDQDQEFKAIARRNKLLGSGLATGEGEVRRKMDELMSVAREQIKGE